jgi:hypothetical protein
MFLNTPGSPLVSGDYLQNFYYDNLRGQLKLGFITGAISLNRAGIK